jgi:hypothetical protein
MLALHPLSGGFMTSPGRAARRHALGSPLSRCRLIVTLAIATACEQPLLPHGGVQTRIGDFVLSTRGLATPDTVAATDSIIVLLDVADPAACTFADAMWMATGDRAYIVPYGVRNPIPACPLPRVALPWPGLRARSIHGTVLMPYRIVVCQPSGDALTRVVYVPMALTDSTQRGVMTLRRDSLLTYIGSGDAFRTDAKLCGGSKTPL